MKVVLADNDESELTAAANEVGGIAVPTDVSNAEQVAKLYEQAFAVTGHVHFCFFNAGIGAGGGALDPWKAWEKTLSVNTYGAIHCCQAFVPKMKATGNSG